MRLSHYSPSQQVRNLIRLVITVIIIMITQSYVNVPGRAGNIG